MSDTWISLILVAILGLGVLVASAVEVLLPNSKPNPNLPGVRRLRCRGVQGDERRPAGNDREGVSQMVVNNFEVNANGHPAGGTSTGLGIEIVWQNGPVQDAGGRNGAFIEDLLGICAARLQFYQNGEFRCRENALAITKIEEAVHWLEHRTRDRQARGVEGAYQP